MNYQLGHHQCRPKLNHVPQPINCVFWWQIFRTLVSASPTKINNNNRLEDNQHFDWCLSPPDRPPNHSEMFALNLTKPLLEPTWRPTDDGGLVFPADTCARPRGEPPRVPLLGSYSSVPKNLDDVKLGRYGARNEIHFATHTCFPPCLWVCLCVCECLLYQPTTKTLARSSPPRIWQMSRYFVYLNCLHSS